MRKIKVMHLTNTIAREASAETLILALVQKMDRSRFQPYVACLTEPRLLQRSFVERAKEIGCSVEFLPWSRRKPFVSSIFKLLRLIKKNQIHLLHTHDLRTDFVGLVAARLARIPVVASIHGRVMKTVSLKLKIYQLIDWLVVKFFDHLIVGSDALRQEIIKSGLSPAKVSTVHNAIKIEKLDPGLGRRFREKFHLNQDLLVGTVGRLSREKGHHFLLQAIPRVTERVPKTKFLIVGEGTARKELEESIQEMNLSEKVILTGFYENLSEILSAIDLFVLPSLSESLPLVVLEAMGSEKAVVGTNVGGVPEVVKQRENGLLVEPGKSDELAEAIIYLLENKQAREKFGKTGLEYVKQHFSVDSLVKKTEALYTNVLSKQDGNRR